MRGPSDLDGGTPGGRTERAPAEVACPFCDSRETELFSLFGSSPLTSQYYCRGCRTVFERVKWGAAVPQAAPPRP